jgi:hypothetical protein
MFSYNLQKPIVNKYILSELRNKNRFYYKQQNNQLNNELLNNELLNNELVKASPYNPEDKYIVIPIISFFSFLAGYYFSKYYR